MRHFSRLIAVLMVAPLLADYAQSNDEDFEAWQQVIVSTEIRPGTTGYMEVQTRFDDDASRFNQLLLRPSIGFKVWEDVELTLGYAYVLTEPTDGPDTYENRIWEQISFPILTRPGAFTLSNRTRLEQRFRDDETSWRLREQLRLVIPTDQPGFDVVGWSEVFFNLNDTDWAGEAGLDRWRNFAGIGLSLSPGMRLEPGYMNQLVNRTSGDTVDHILNVTLNVRY
ncbi:MAG: DUF2490 domain-containing protein [Hyphomicrobium sp.]|jgi:hypothetical protein|nr:DUF2490 domain-containing protein [Hyphomicrobium sp.]